MQKNRFGLRSAFVICVLQVSYVASPQGSSFVLRSCSASRGGWSSQYCNRIVIKSSHTWSGETQLKPSPVEL
eukprot:3051293-Prymnesium_polylepis.1